MDPGSLVLPERGSPVRRLRRGVHPRAPQNLWYGPGGRQHHRIPQSPSGIRYADQSGYGLGNQQQFLLHHPGHAVLQAKPFLEGKPGQTLVIYGDTPLVETETLRQIFHIHEKNRYDMTVVSAILDNPKGYGRILREDKSNRILAIREESDCTFSEYEINEVNTGICIIDNELLFKYIERLSVDNNRHLFYLSELVQLFIQDNYHVGVFVAEEMKEVYSINNRIQLAYATKIMRKRINNRLMLSGVSMDHSGSTYISPDVTIGQDTIIRPNTTILGKSVIGEACIIGPNVVLKDVEVGNEAQITFADLENVKVEKSAKVGPFVVKHGN